MDILVEIAAIINRESGSPTKDQSEKLDRAMEKKRKKKRRRVGPRDILNERKWPRYVNARWQTYMTAWSKIPHYGAAWMAFANSAKRVNSITHSQI